MTVSQLRVVPALLASPLRGLPILVIDEDGETRHELLKLLDCWGARPVVTADIAEATRLAGANSNKGEPFIGALISHLGPSCDAFQIVNQLRAQRLRVGPICLLLSPATEPHVRLAVRCLRLGIAAYLIKPLLTEDLFDLLMALREGPAVSADPERAEDAWLGAARRLRFLLVEDNPVNQIEAAAQIQFIGHEVHSVVSGHAALSALAEIGFKSDCVLLDLCLPDMTGLTVARLIREREAAHGESLPIIGLTGSAAPPLAGVDPIRDQCLEAGMDDLLYKPLRLPQLFPSLNRALRKRTIYRAPLASQDPKMMVRLGRAQSRWVQHMSLSSK